MSNNLDKENMKTNINNVKEVVEILETNLETNETIVKNVVKDVVKDVGINKENLKKEKKEQKEKKKDEMLKFLKEELIKFEKEAESSEDEEEVDKEPTNNNELSDLNKDVLKTPQKFAEELDDKDSIFHNVKDLFRGMELDLSNVMLYSARVIEMVDIFSVGTGDEKKQIVIDTLMSLISENLELTKEDKDFILLMVDGLIETILKTSKKEINLSSKLNTKQKKVSMSVGQLVDSLVDKCATIVKANRYKVENVIVNIPIMVGMVMSIVESYDTLSGTEKKGVVVKVIKNLLSKKLPKLVKIDKSHQKKLNLVIQIIPTIIDVLIDVSNGKYNINEKLSLLKKLFCCCCTSSKKSKIQKEKKKRNKNKK